VVWAFLETVEGTLHDTARKMATEARRLGRMLGAGSCVVVVSTAPAPEAMVADAIALGPDSVAVLEHTGCEEAPAVEAVALALSGVLGDEPPPALLFAATPFSADVATRLGARLSTGVVTNCVDYEVRDGDLVCRRSVCGGRVHADVTWVGDGPRLATVDLASLEAADGDTPRGEVPVSYQRVALEGTRTESLRRWRLPPREIDITEAEFVIGVGRPVEHAQLATIEALADRMGAAVGGSRVAVFRGTIPKERQIGSSGKWISPRVYVTLGISGASYHVMGIKGARHIIAVNTDQDAPIFRLAELGIVAPIEEFVGALSDELEAART
jgi:electron transfer flavoprotein alpha subunit